MGILHLTAWFIVGVIALRVLIVAFVVVGIARIVVAVRGRSNGAEEIAARRFASGEITAEELRRIRDALNP